MIHKAMVPVQYRDPETEDILDYRFEEAVPDIGTSVQLGFERFQVLFRWQCVPTACIVYVRPVPREAHAAA